MQAYPLSGIMGFRQLIIAYVCRWDNLYRKCSMLVSSKISKMAVWSQSKSERIVLTNRKKFFCRNSSLVTSIHNKLTINDLKCDELRFWNVTHDYPWRVGISTHHTLTTSLSGRWKRMWRVTSFCKKTFSGLSAAVCVMRSNMLLCIFCVAI